MAPSGERHHSTKTTPGPGTSVLEHKEERGGRGQERSAGHPGREALLRLWALWADMVPHSFTLVPFSFLLGLGRHW